MKRDKKLNIQIKELQTLGDKLQDFMIREYARTKPHSEYQRGILKGIAIAVGKIHARRSKKLMKRKG